MADFKRYLITRVDEWDNNHSIRCGCCDMYVNNSCVINVQLIIDCKEPRYSDMNTKNYCFLCAQQCGWKEKDDIVYEEYFEKPEEEATIRRTISHKQVKIIKREASTLRDGTTQRIEMIKKEMFNNS